MALSKSTVLFCALTTYHNKNTRMQSMFYNLSSLRSKMFAEDNDVDGASTRRQVMNCKGTVEGRSGSPASCCSAAAQ